MSGVFGFYTIGGFSKNNKPPADQRRSNKAPYFTTLKVEINRSDLS
nr:MULTISPECIES: hypothetical protein [Enterobacteriaceae]